MRSGYRIVESDGIYFLTATVVEWMPVFYGEDVCGIITSSLSHCREAKGV